MTNLEEQFLNGVICGPHCDARVLHAPGECEYCDGFPLAQKLRATWGINYTGEHDPGKLPCPAELLRPVEAVHAWGGNQPRFKPEQIGDVSRRGDS